jgi:hypothetical protein
MIFDDWKSIFHFIVGFIAGFSIWFYLSFSASLSAIFICYQLIESESVSELFSDFAEFICGFALGCVMFHICRLVLNINF